MDQNDPHAFGVDDLARLMAIEHMVTTLWSFFAFNQADAFGRPAADVARELSEGIHGTIIDGRLPHPVRDRMRGHVNRLMDVVIANAETADSFKG